MTSRVAAWMWKHKMVTAAVLIVLIVIATMTGGNGSGSTRASVAGDIGTAAPPAQPTLTTPASPTTRLAHLVVAHGVALPDRARTPGGALRSATKARVCTPGYASAVRDVSAATRRQVFAEYGISYARHTRYEVDHLVPLELGGSNALRNLWPEPVGPGGTGYPAKDRLENHLHALVCTGQLSLTTARLAIAHNWYAAAVRYAAVTVLQPTQLAGGAPRRTAVPVQVPTQRTPARTTATGDSAASGSTHSASTGSGSTASDSSSTARSSSTSPVPSSSPAPATGPTAQCNDGTYSYAAHHQGACSHHGGVAKWFR